MKRFYCLLAALLLLPVSAFAQEEPIQEACSEDPEIGFWYGELLITAPTDIADSYVVGATSQQGDEEWGDTTGLLPPGFIGEVVIARDPGANPGDDPDEGCTDITNADEINGNIALIRRGACSFSLKALNAQAAGAAAFLVYNDERPDFKDWQIINMAATAGEGLQVMIPGLFLPRALGNAIVSQIEDFENPVLVNGRYQACYVTGVDAEENVVPGRRELSAAYPNPFARTTSFDLVLDEAQNVTVDVFNVLGQRVASLHNGALAGGTTHTFEFEAGALPSGVYLYRVVGETFAQTRQITLAR